MLVYTNLYIEKHFDGNFGKRVISMSMYEFQTFAVPINDNMKENNARNHHSQSVLVLLILLYSLNPPLYSKDDNTPKIERDLN